MKINLNWDTINTLQKFLFFGLDPQNIYIRFNEEEEIFVGIEGLDKATFERLAPLLRSLNFEQSRN